MDDIKVEENKEKHLKSFRIRSKDKCQDPKCGKALIITGVAEEGDKTYKIMCACEGCKKIYEFIRIKRCLIERKA